MIKQLLNSQFVVVAVVVVVAAVAVAVVVVAIAVVSANYQQGNNEPTYQQER